MQCSICHMQDIIDVCLNACKNPCTVYGPKYRLDSGTPPLNVEEVLRLHAIHHVINLI